MNMDIKVQNLDCGRLSVFKSFILLQFSYYLIPFFIVKSQATEDYYKFTIM